MTEVTVKLVHWHMAPQRDALRQIRQQVFIREQGVTAELEWDGLDDTAIHFLAHNDKQQFIACARLLANGHIGRMAVLKTWRHQGVGTAVMHAILDYARGHQYPPLFLHAQTRAVTFYQSLGFCREGEEFLDAGIAHIGMRLQK